MKHHAEHLLWERFKQGDRDAFRSLYELFVPALLNYGAKLSSDANVVEDCIQDLFIELWSSGQKLSSTTSVKFYLFKALRNKITRTQNVRSLSSAMTTDELELYERIPSEEDNIINMETHLSSVEILQEQIKLLPERQREAINLRYYHNFSNEEMAEIMGINYHSACKSLYAALKSLKLNVKVAVVSLAFIISLPALFL